MRGLAAPGPQHQIAVIGRSSRSEARHDHTGAAGGNEPIGQVPGRNSLAVAGKTLPGAAELRQGDLCYIPRIRVRQVENFRKFGAVAADRKRLRFEGESLLSLKPGGFEAERRIEASRADAVEAAAVKLRAFTRFRIIGPGRMMRTIDQAVEPDERQGRFRNLLTCGRRSYFGSTLNHA